MRRDPSPQPSPAGRGGCAERFSEGAARLAGIAGAVLGWRPDEFWRATPAELSVIFEAMTGERAQGVAGADLERLRQMFPDEVGDG